VNAKGDRVPWIAIRGSQFGVRRTAFSLTMLALGWLAAPEARAQAPRAVETFDAAWRIIRDTHFDRTMNGVDWDAVRTQLRPRAAAARDTAELREVLHDMVGRLGQ
jgi:hypothetical protein